MNVFFTSDQHYQHINIIKYCNRPFADVSEMNDKLIENHNSIVSEGDLVINLGDFCWQVDMVPDILSKLNGTQILISGNHDACHPYNSGSINKINKYIEAGFKEVKLEMDFEEFVLNHFPFSKNEFEDDRFNKYRLKPSGKPLLHGHIHSTPKNMLRGNMLDVGVDAHQYRPIPLAAVRHIFKDII